MDKHFLQYIPNPVAHWGVASLAKKGNCFSSNVLCPLIKLLPVEYRLFLSVTCSSVNASRRSSDFDVGSRFEQAVDLVLRAPEGRTVERGY